MKNISPLSDLEMFELLQLCYPERCPDESDKSWDAAQEFAEEISGFEAVADLLGRVVMLSMPMKSGLTGRFWHSLGKVSMQEDRIDMCAAVTREFTPPSHYTRSRRNEQ